MSLASEKIRIWAIGAGVSQRHLAALVGTYQANVSLILAGKTQPTLDTIQKFLTVVPGLEATDFLTAAAEAPSSPPTAGLARAPRPAPKSPQRRPARAPRKGARR